jgi:hypothetical protein
MLTRVTPNKFRVANHATSSPIDSEENQRMIKRRRRDGGGARGARRFELVQEPQKADWGTAAIFKDCDGNQLVPSTP